MEYALLDRIKKEAYQGRGHYANQSVYAPRLLLQLVTQVIKFHVPRRFTDFQLVQPVRMVVNAALMGV